jgi:hypothetical protein
MCGCARRGMRRRRCSGHNALKGRDARREQDRGILEATPRPKWIVMQGAKVGIPPLSVIPTQSRSAKKTCAEAQGRSLGFSSCVPWGNVLLMLTGSACS